mmetsp:Transcript_40679/g.86554  ORF Transcript_40679/g.86554 Transcript_40679/m.86554 type:complete len:217 (-) Transcript_40679:3042-3692(-)
MPGVRQGIAAGGGDVGAEGVLGERPQAPPSRFGVENPLLKAEGPGPALCRAARVPAAIGPVGREVLAHPIRLQKILAGWREGKHLHAAHHATAAPKPCPVACCVLPQDADKGVTKALAVDVRATAHVPIRVGSVRFHSCEEPAKILELPCERCAVHHRTVGIESVVAVHRFAATLLVMTIGERLNARCPGEAQEPILVASYREVRVCRRRVAIVPD